MASLPLKSGAEVLDRGFEDFLFFDREGELVPPIYFVDKGRKPQVLTDFAGQALVLNFWATWCAPCVAEIPALDRLNREIEGENARVLIINTDFTIEAGQALLSRNQIRSLDFFWDETGDTFFDVGGSGMPYTLILDADGRIVAEVFGAAPWGSDEAIAFVRGMSD